MEKQQLPQQTEVPSWMAHAKILGRKIVREETERREREERLLVPSARVLDEDEA